MADRLAPVGTLRPMTCAGLVPRVFDGGVRVNVGVVAVPVVLGEHALGVRRELLRLPSRELHHPRQGQPDRKVEGALRGMDGWLAVGELSMIPFKRRCGVMDRGMTHVCSSDSCCVGPCCRQAEVSSERDMPWIVLAVKIASRSGTCLFICIQQLGFRPVYVLEGPPERMPVLRPVSGMSPTRCGTRIQPSRSRWEGSCRSVPCASSSSSSWGLSGWKRSVLEIGGPVGSPRDRLSRWTPLSFPDMLANISLFRLCGCFQRH